VLTETGPYHVEGSRWVETGERIAEASPGQTKSTVDCTLKQWTVFVQKMFQNLTRNRGFLNILGV